ncbi:hypothetical protein DQ04_16231000, partial [Trypanosoma grayi]|uniref:hypothetical protein n=1 Tax=Trypanosoma grayi TaxID=71804 RepID=UPI0004F43757
MATAKHVSGGCVQSCGLNRQESGGEFNCHVRARGRGEEVILADIVINHNGPVPRRFANGRPYTTLFYSGESNYTDYKRGNDAYQRQYDEVVSFHQHRRYYFTWAKRHQSSFMDIIRSNKGSNGEAYSTTWSVWKQRQSAIAVFVSRCKARRVEVIHRLSRYYPVHSYGKCAKNKKIPPQCATIGGRYLQKMCVMRKYKYAMALENSREQDYVTEKVYH